MTRPSRAKGRTRKTPAAKESLPSTEAAQTLPDVVIAYYPAIGDAKPRQRQPSLDIPTAEHFATYVANAGREADKFEALHSLYQKRFWPCDPERFFVEVSIFGTPQLSEPAAFTADLIGLLIGFCAGNGPDNGVGKAGPRDGWRITLGWSQLDFLREKMQTVVRQSGRSEEQIGVDLGYPKERAVEKLRELLFLVEDVRPPQLNRLAKACGLTRFEGPASAPLGGTESRAPARMLFELEKKDNADNNSSHEASFRPTVADEGSIQPIPADAIPFTPPQEKEPQKNQQKATAPLAPPDSEKAEANLTATLEELVREKKTFAEGIAQRLAPALNRYLQTQQPKDFLTKQALAMSVSATLEQLGLSVRYGNRPCNFMAAADPKNPRGRFFLVPQGQSTATRVRARLADLLPMELMETAPRREALEEWRERERQRRAAQAAREKT